ncbi:MAG: site-2 protease family protein [Oscillospiraceae bacterium]|jgi:regulator of sigma E protease|nr:site-2 protease family protein [Oscillospiraceae bacterium]
MYIVLAILIFGILIAIHELGHFVAAKKLGVKVNEFAIGMGPKLWSKKKGETVYAIRLLPIGGACVMEGEDEDNPDPRSFNAQKRWKRVIILAAGAFMNFMFGLVIVLILYMGVKNITGTTLDGFLPGFPGEGENGLMAGDTIIAVDGARIWYKSDFALFMSMPDAEDGIVDLVIRRDGQKLRLDNFPLAPREYEGYAEKMYGLQFLRIEPTFGARLNYSTYTAFNFARLVKVGLVQLFSGDAQLKDLSGPVGIVTAINEAGNNPNIPSFADRLANVFYLGAFIAVNLAVMNLLPIPALDGGRIFGIVVTFIIEKITKKRVNPKYEGYIHAGGLALLMLLMVVVMVNDVLRIV